MKLRPGCGCLILVLSVMNILLVFLLTYGLVRGTANRTPQAFAMLLVFVSDVIVCFMVGLAAVRLGGRKPEAADGETEGDEGEGGKKSDEGEEPETSDTDDM